MSYQPYVYTPSNQTQRQRQQQQQQARNVGYSTDNTTTTVPSAPWHHLQFRAPVPVPTLPTVQHQPSLWTTQTTMPSHHHRTEATLPSMPVNPGAPALTQLQNVASPVLVKTGGTEAGSTTAANDSATVEEAPILDV